MTRVLAGLALVVAMLIHPAVAVAEPHCTGAGPFCARVQLDPSAVTDAR